MEIHVASMTEASNILNISRNELYRRVRKKEVLVETFYKDGKRVYKLYQTAPDLALAKAQPGTKTVKQSAPGIERGDVVMPKKQAHIQTTARRGMHAQYIAEWLKWYEDGVDVNAWAASHKRDQIQYIHRYFDRFDVIAAENLRVWLAEVDRNRVTLRRHMHGAVLQMSTKKCTSMTAKKCTTPPSIFSVFFSPVFLPAKGRTGQERKRSDS